MSARLYLVTPPVSDALGFRPLLMAALNGAPVECMWLKVDAPDEKAAQRITQALAAVIQDKGVAVIIDPPGDLREVARGGIDGVHISSPDSLKAALEELKPDRIVGAGGLNSRDEAMSAGEAGADYVMFGDPRADGSVPVLDKVLERCQWWAEVFNVPCVAYAPSPEAVAPLAATGVEFVALGGWVFAGDVSANISNAVRALDGSA